MRPQTTSHDPWQGLNQQQQRSLQAIYAIDQWQEEIERHRAKTTHRSRPASEWRWMRYGLMALSGNPSPLMAQLLDAQLVGFGYSRYVSDARLAWLYSL